MCKFLIMRLLISIDSLVEDISGGSQFVQNFVAVE